MISFIFKVLPGTKIHYDSGLGYICITEEGYLHETMNHLKNSGGSRV